jgi:protein SCO1/2
MRGCPTTTWLCTTALLLFIAACGGGREYELRGQILAIDHERQEVTVKHEDIRGFMPGMTMPFKVRRGTLLDGRKPGDLIRATLVVEETDAYLRTLEATGHAPLAETPPSRARVLDSGEPVPDAAFIDQRGIPRTLADWKGRVLAVTFIYTRCPVPNFCPLMDRRFAEVQKAVAADGNLRDAVHLLSVSFDPAFDTPAVLAAHAARIGADPAVWTFLTGDRREIERFGARLGMSIVPDPASAPEIVHNLRTAIIGADGRLVKIFHGSEWQAAELVTVLQAARDARSFGARR